MNLDKELSKLAEYIGTDTKKFEEHFASLIKSVEKEDDKNKIIAFVENKLSDKTTEISDFIDQATIKIQLADKAKILPLSYISEKYFHKTRQWLYQRINGNIVNGKPAKFTSDEIKTLNIAFQDISKMIGSITIQ